jgi:hypothetical protein
MEKTTMMKENLSLRDAERRALRLAAFQDGSVDMFLGCSLILMSFYAVLRDWLGPVKNGILVIGILLLLMVGVILIKKYIYAPRAGLVRFSQAQKGRIKALRIVTVVLVIATFLVWILVQTGVITRLEWEAGPEWLKTLALDILFAAFTIGFFGLIAYVFGIARLHLYGWLFGLGNLASTILHRYWGISIHYPVMIGGGIILSVGVVLLVRFLRDYPIPTEEA